MDNQNINASLFFFFNLVSETLAYTEAEMLLTYNDAARKMSFSKQIFHLAYLFDRVLVEMS